MGRRNCWPRGDLNRARNRGVSRRVLLAITMHEAYLRLLDRLEGITDEGFFWQPVLGAWTSTRTSSATGPTHEIPDPDPAPVMTTIACQVVHLVTTRFMYAIG